MLSWFRRRAEERQRAIDLYGAVVTLARTPSFFTADGVHDTPEGRAAMIIVMIFPVLERLQAGDARDKRLARLTTEAFVTDIDDCLREMGVGDLSVPKKVKRTAQALGERCLAYRRAATGPEPDAALARELATTVPGLENSPEGAKSLAAFVLQLMGHARASTADRLQDLLTATRSPANAGRV